MHPKVLEMYLRVVLQLKLKRNYRKYSNSTVRKEQKAQIIAKSLKGGKLRLKLPQTFHLYT